VAGVAVAIPAPRREVQRIFGGEQAEDVAIVELRRSRFGNQVLVIPQPRRVVEQVSDRHRLRGGGQLGQEIRTDWS